MYTYQERNSDLNEKLKIQQNIIAEIQKQENSKEKILENCPPVQPVQSLIVSSNPTKLDSNLDNQLLPLNHPSSQIYQENTFNNPWIIIVFSDIGYSPITEVWYQQMSDIGYHNTRIYALDTATYRHFSLKNDTAGQAYRIFYPAHNSSDLLDRDWESGIKRKQKDYILKHIWEIRLKTCATLIQNNYNVMLTDVDSIWLKYYKLSSLPNFIDGFYGTGTTFPKDVYKTWHLVLHGGMFAFHSNPRTKLFWKVLAEKCNHCDDQALVNRVVKNVYGIREWDEIPGSSIRIGYGTNSLLEEEELEKQFQMEILKEGENSEITSILESIPNEEQQILQPRKKRSIKYKRKLKKYKQAHRMTRESRNLKAKQNPNAIKLMIFSKNQVLRQGTVECTEEKWILSPNSGKSAKAKLQSFKTYQGCFSDGARQLIENLLSGR